MNTVFKISVGCIFFCFFLFHFLFCYRLKGKELDNKKLFLYMVLIGITQIFIDAIIIACLYKIMVSI